LNNISNKNIVKNIKHNTDSKWKIRDNEESDLDDQAFLLLDEHHSYNNTDANQLNDKVIN